MNKDKLILKNGTEIEIESGASLSNIKVLSETKEKMLDIWNEMTEDNLKSVCVNNGDGITIARYSDLILISETSIIQSDATILSTFVLREKTDIEKRLDALEEQMEIHDASITDALAKYDA